MNQCTWVIENIADNGEFYVAGACEALASGGMQAAQCFYYIIHCKCYCHNIFNFETC